MLIQNMRLCQACEASHSAPPTHAGGAGGASPPAGASKDDEAPAHPVRHHPTPTGRPDAWTGSAPTPRASVPRDAGRRAVGFRRTIDKAPANRTLGSYAPAAAARD